MKSQLVALFSAADLERVRAAVGRAEGRTSGEIVPYVVERSDGYEGAAWKAAALGAVCGPLVALALRVTLDYWGGAGGVWLVAPAVLGALAGLLAGRLAAVKRAMVPEAVMTRRVQRRAAVAFLEEEVFSTSERTGTLIFLSVFERRVVVLGDSGINRRVSAQEWQAVTDGLVEGIRAGRAAEALIEALGRCGEFLERKGVERRAEDENELADDLRTRET